MYQLNTCFILFTLFFCNVKSLNGSFTAFFLFFFLFFFFSLLLIWRWNLFKSLFSILQKYHILSKRNAVLHINSKYRTQIKILWNGLVWNALSPIFLLLRIDCFWWKKKRERLFSIGYNLKMLCFPIYISFEMGGSVYISKWNWKPYLPMYIHIFYQSN